MRLWNLQSGAETRSLYAPNFADVDISPDGRTFLVTDGFGDVQLWDTERWQEIRRLKGHTEMIFAGATFNADGSRIVSASGDIFAASEDNTVRLWNVETGQEIRRFEHDAHLWDVDICQCGPLAVSGSNDGKVHILNLETGEKTLLLDIGPQTARSVAFSPDGSTILVGPGKGLSSTPNYDIHLLDTETGEEIRRFKGHTEVVGDIIFSADGSTAFSGSQDKLIIMWDVESGREIRRFAGHTAGIGDIELSPDERTLLSGGLDGMVILWDVEHGMAIRHYLSETRLVLGVAFAPDGRSALSGGVSDYIVREWRIDVSQEELMAWVEANRYVPELTCLQRVQYNIHPFCDETAR
jgi:WD40 repeat protein